MFNVNSTSIFRFYQCWFCSFKGSILKILSNVVHLKCKDSKEFYETRSVNSCSIFLCRFAQVSPCFMIILCTKPVGTRSRDFLSLLSKLALESAKHADIGKHRLKGIGIMCGMLLGLLALKVDILMHDTHTYPTNHVVPLLFWLLSSGRIEV